MEHYQEIMRFLEEEPLLKEKFEELRDSLETFSDNYSREEFEARWDEYLGFLELLDEIVALPKKEFLKKTIDK